MINQQESIDKNVELKQRKRPVFLVVLIVLSGLYIVSNLFTVIRSLLTGPFSESELEEELAGLYASIAELQASGVGEQFISMTETIIENAIYINNEVFLLTNLITLITLLIGALSLYLMFNLKKIGFHVYIVYSLLPIITMYMITPMELILTFSIVLSVIVPAIFGILYGLNLKHMK